MMAKNRKEGGVEEVTLDAIEENQSSPMSEEKIALQKEQEAAKVDAI